MEIGDWRCPYNKVNSKVYTKTYLRKYGMSEPTEEWDDRNRMYSVYYDIIYSVNHMAQGKSVRQMYVADLFPFFSRLLCSLDMVFDTERTSGLWTICPTWSISMHHRLEKARIP